jgi:hypothetical protein
VGDKEEDLPHCASRTTRIIRLAAPRCYPNNFFDDRISLNAQLLSQFAVRIQSEERINVLKQCIVSDKSPFVFDYQ